MHHRGSVHLELTTWIGDIGGGAGMLAFRRASNPQKRAVDMFSDGHNFGGWINIEGNIAAYIIGRDTKNFDATPNVSSNDNAYVADMLQAYLLPQPALPNSEWHNRAKTFTIMLGANLDNQGNITNEAQFKAELTKKILDFAENYALQQTFREPQVKMYEVSKHLDGAAKEMTEIFIHTLKEAIKNPAAPIRTKGINPNPTPPGKPQTIFRMQKNIEDGLKQLEEWIKK